MHTKNFSYGKCTTELKEFCIADAGLKVLLEDLVNTQLMSENIFSFQGQTTVIQDSTKWQQIKISSHRTEEKISITFDQGH